MQTLSSGSLTLSRARRIQAAHQDRGSTSPPARPPRRPARRALSQRARDARQSLPREQARLRAHFRRVLAELAASDVTHLSASQRANRAHLVAELARYARAGRFPRNLDFPGRRMPYFVDAFGTRCAMAHLIESTGGAALVAQIAATKNNAFIREIEGDVTLAAWLEHWGLTAAEAARIQPDYCGNEVWADTCFCKNLVDSNGAIEGTVLASVGPEKVLVRVDAVHPAPKRELNETVGQELEISSSAPVGSVVLFQVAAYPEQSKYESVHVVQADGTVSVSCDLAVPPLSKEAAIAGMAAGDSFLYPEIDPTECGRALAKLDPTWGNLTKPCTGDEGGSGAEDPGGGGCSAGLAGGGSPLLIATSIVFAAVWSRRRARSGRGLRRR